jgi:tetratricopeptide (TPR) repeat protein
VLVLSIEGLPEGVQTQRRGATRWDRAYTNQVLDAGDLFRTGPRSRALLRFSNLETFRVDERSTLRIPEDRKPRRALEFIRGVFYFFHRDRPGDLEIRTRLVNAVVRGTEFVIEVEEDGTTRLHLIDGEVEMTNDFGGLELRSGQSSETVPGQPPRRTAAVTAINVMQWCLYYPGILNVDELGLNAQEQADLRPSLEAYRAGDLLAALASYPEARTPASARERIFLAALLLSVGEVTQAEAELKQLKPDTTDEQRLAELAGALQSVIATVQGRPPKAGQAGHPPYVAGQHLDAKAPALSTLLLADSYAWQAQSKLEEALESAKQATLVASDFAFAWTRVADLEFGFGRTRAARAALERSLELAPRNAQAVALKGFLLAADNKFADAEPWFNRAIALDGGLGNAWLGRGLCRIQRGQKQAGLQDLQIAATVEPQRALLRSYLGKAFSHAGDNKLAAKELALARNWIRTIPPRGFIPRSSTIK